LGSVVVLEGKREAVLEETEFLEVSGELSESALSVADEEEESAGAGGELRAEVGIVGHRVSGRLLSEPKCESIAEDDIL